MSNAPKAARMGHGHFCPRDEHVGGDILAPCMPTVLFNGKPAARVNDSADCKVALDQIEYGEPTVVVGGRHVARMGDPTVDGGKITEGSPDILIGRPAAYHKAIRMKQRLAVVEAAEAKAKQDTVENRSSEIQIITSRMRDYISGADGAPFAKATYCDDPNRAPVGSTLINGQLPPEFDKVKLDDTKTGFHADVFRRDNGEIVVAYRGTDTRGTEIIPDIVHGWVQGTGHFGLAMPSQEQFDQAEAVANAAVRAFPGQVTFVGHSMGGGQTAYVSGLTGRPGTSYNAQGLSTAARWVAGPFDKVTNFHNTRDPLSNLQESRRYDPLGMAPPAVGRFVPVPPASGDRVLQHGMDDLSDSIEAQKRAGLAVLQNYLKEGS